MRIVLCNFLFLLNITFSQAQQFKWVHGGGTIEDFSSLPSHESEQTEYMCTDPNGNVYALSQVGNDPIVADTFHGLAHGADVNLLITSYNCNGQMRWSKLISTTAGDCTAFGIMADSLGHIYVAGDFLGVSSGGILHIGYDTAIAATGSEFLAIGLIQLDTTGHFDWIRYVGPSTFAAATSVYGGPITLDGSNNAHYFCYITSGTLLMPGVTSTYGVYDMTYNAIGALLSAVRLDLDSEWYLHGAVIDPATNKLYVYGEVNQSFGAGVDTFYAAAFDVSRNKLWQYVCGHGDDDGFSGIVLDNAKRLHLSGGTQSSTFSFNGDSVSASHFAGNMAVVMTTDTNGHVEWFRKFESTSSENSFTSITLLPNNKVAAVGGFIGTVLDPTTSLSFSTSPTAADNPYFVVLDSAGYLETMQQVYADGGGVATAVTADRIGNIYFGGEMGDSAWGGTIPAYHTVGGNTDFFVMKYGVDCSCASMPTAAYSDTGSATIGFTYTGTTSGIDSTVWNFGDGSATAATTNPIHTYTASGNYTACVTVYSSCGNDMHCTDVTVSICTVTPTASFSDTGTHTIGFTYTGTTTGIDSVVWNFGDGITGTGTGPLHTYTATGTYTVCVTAYTNCRSDSACHTVVVSTTGVTGLCLGGVQVYPNPAKDELYVTGVPQNTSYRLLNVTGECVMMGDLKVGMNTISTNSLSAGVYILEMTGADGLRNIVRVVKG